MADTTREARPGDALRQANERLAAAIAAAITDFDQARALRYTSIHNPAPGRDTAGMLDGVTGAAVDVPDRKRTGANLSFLSTLAPAMTPLASTAEVGDGVRLAQVFANLLHNASRFGGQGRRIAVQGAATATRRW